MLYFTFLPLLAAILSHHHDTTILMRQTKQEIKGSDDRKTQGYTAEAPIEQRQDGSPPLAILPGVGIVVVDAAAALRGNRMPRRWSTFA